MAEKTELLAKACSYAGMSLKFVRGDAGHGQPVKCEIAGKCDNGIDDFSFSTMGYPTEAEAAGAALAYLLSSRGSPAGPGEFVSRLHIANSEEELELKLAAMD